MADDHAADLFLGARERGAKLRNALVG